MNMAYKFLDATGNWSDPASTTYKYLRADGQWVAPDSEHLFLDATGNWSQMTLTTDYSKNWAIYSDGTLVIAGPNEENFDSHGSILYKGSDLDINHHYNLPVGGTAPWNDTYADDWDNVHNGPMMKATTSVTAASEIAPLHTQAWFYYNSQITYCDLTKLDVSNVISMDNMFDGCSNLKTVHIDDWLPSSEAHLYSMFSGCCVLENIYCRNIWSFSNAENNIFGNCYRLKGYNQGGPIGDSKARPYPDGFFTMP